MSTKSTSTPSLLDTKSQTTDWFIPAIQSNGSVGESLSAVLELLDEKRRFLNGLIASIAEKSPGAMDAVSDIGQRIRLLDNTLRFRLTILSPERKGAWFRPATATTGPFKENLMPEPVFSAYNDDFYGRVRSGFSLCWEKRNLVDYPLSAKDPSLWKVLLSLNFELERIETLETGFPKLSELPIMLPAHLESRSLRAFLTNVRAEILSHRSRLADCYKMLLDASDRYWRFHATTASQKTTKSAGPNHEKAPLRDRRSPTTPRNRFKNSSDIEALKFMGFADYPKSDDLKQRYHSLALTMHPDRPTGNEQRFKMLTKSYKHLSKVCVDL